MKNETKGERIKRITKELEELLECGDVTITYTNKTGIPLFFKSTKTGYGQHSIEILTESQAGEYISEGGNVKNLMPFSEGSKLINKYDMRPDK